MKAYICGPHLDELEIGNETLCFDLKLRGQPRKAWPQLNIKSREERRKAKKERIAPKLDLQLRSLQISI